MKHAVLILAHNNFEVVKTLLRQFDQPCFDIYIHISAKVKTYPKTDLQACINKASLTFVNRVKTGYCNYRQLEGVLSLLRESSGTYHDYYHLISGADLRIKTLQYFNEFFHLNNGKEFVGFSSSVRADSYLYRNYFISQCRQKSRFLSLVFINLRKMLIQIQKVLHREISFPFEVKKGCDWYSLTHNAVCYLLKEEPVFKKYFYHAYCPTEFFAQTLLWNSEYKNRLYGINLLDENKSCLRYIDWNRGTPYVFLSKDIDELMNSGEYMFARKFDQNTDMKVVNQIYELNMEKSL